MVEFEYLAKGVYALARAHQVSAMAGHLGAAVAAGYFVSEQHPDLDEAVCQGIEGELDRIIRGESVFSPKADAPLTAPDMFLPLPKQAAKEDLIDGVADALAVNIDKTRQSGHNVIFASIAIRALRDHPDLATPAIVDGIRKLIVAFNDESPGSGYYGKEKGRIDGRRVDAPPDDKFPPYENLAAMAAVTIDELSRTAAQRRVGYGGLWHLVNHTAALAELAQYGYHDLAVKGLAGHHQHLRLIRTVPDVTDEQGPETPTDDDPRTPAFWQPDKIRRGRAHLTHRVKTLYGFDALIGLIDDAAKREEANLKLRYLM
ncbi:MAG: hypothetical protein KDA41_04450 [Planctomycetales bacterium]|nr:hypothetical protein [Planctomycetales bacterium]